MGYIILISLITLAAILMCFVVLIQNSKGGGLSASFSSANNIMGVRKATDTLEKMTWGLAIAMVVLSVGTAYVLPKKGGVKESTIEKKAVEENASNPLNQPAPFAAPAEQKAETAPAADKTAE
jgi:preprotein translocase subunit SecG